MNSWKSDNWINKLKEDISDSDLDGLYTDKNPKIDIRSGYKDIDGFTVSTEGVYNPSPRELCKKYIEFNDRYFNGELPYLEISQFKVRNVQNWIGLTEIRVCKPNKYSNKLSWAYIKAISVSIRYERSELVYLTTLLHEMIHVYQACVLSIEGDHGRTFIEKMDAINSYGWKVSTKETDEEFEQRGNISKSVTDKILSTKYFGTVDQSDGKVFGFVFPKKNINLLISKARIFKWKNPQVYEILDPKPFVNVSSTTLKSNMSGYKMAKEKISTMKDKMIIKEIDIKFNEAIENSSKTYDPMIKTNIVKELPNGRVIEDMEII